MPCAAIADSRATKRDLVSNWHTDPRISGPQAQGIMYVTRSKTSYVSEVMSAKNRIVVFDGLFNQHARMPVDGRAPHGSSLHNLVSPAVVPPCVCVTISQGFSAPSHGGTLPTPDPRRLLS